MVKFEMLGFTAENKFLEAFFKSLLKTNWTYQYFVDWRKVREKLRLHVKEISLLNSLTKINSSERKKQLEEILFQYPETLLIIPLIIAIRNKKILVLDTTEQVFLSAFNFSKRKLLNHEVKELSNFCEKAGILRLFDEINDLYAYLEGVEVGLDSNARKNRSGKIFENLVGSLLKRKLKGLDVQIKAEDQCVRFGRKKRADFVIYYKGNPRIIIECNFYNTGGSKPIETANAYVDLQRKIRDKADLDFVWITDGPAWNKMKQTIKQSFKEIDFPMNYTIANQKIATIISNLLE